MLSLMLRSRVLLLLSLYYREKNILVLIIGAAISALIGAFFIQAGFAHPQELQKIQRWE